MSALRISGMSAAAAAAVALAVLGAVRSRGQARRHGIPLRILLCLYLTGVLLLLGLAAVLGPSSWVPVGTLLLLAAVGPVVLLLCGLMLGAGPSYAWYWWPVALVAAVALPTGLAGAVAADQHDGPGYVLRYGRAGTADLPRGWNGPTTVRVDGQWWRTMNLEFGPGAWDRYGHYYTVAGLDNPMFGPEPGSADDPTGVTVKVLVVDGTAFETTGLHAGTPGLAPLGLEPLPKLLWGLLPGLLIPFLLLVSVSVRAKRRRALRNAKGTYYVPPRPPGPRPAGGGRTRPSARRPKPAPSGAGTTPADRIYEAATRQHKQRHRPYRMTVSSRQVRVTVGPDGFAVEQSITGTWRSHLDLPWRDVSGLEFAQDYRDPVVSLYVLPAQGTRRHALDSSHLTGADWAEVADAVAAKTDGRVRLDLAGRDGGHVNPDA
ncbi:hypothetical protein [Streptomyces sp. NPDC020917]|uniref:hypothetical protein n=1 Tax=Streptomyces sp. NPDC020917 TaxID=3365102 RepID=UPI00378FDEC4